MPRSRCRKGKSTAGHAQVFLLIETTSRQAPAVSPSHQNVAPHSLLNGNSGNSIARRIEHRREIVQNKSGWLLADQLVQGLK